LTEVRNGDVQMSEFGCRIRLPQREILEGRIGFKGVEGVVDGQGLVNIFERVFSNQ